jgi:hypothetical protein
VAIQPVAAEAAPPAFRPKKPSRPDEVGLSTNRLADLLLKHLYFKSPMSGLEWAAAIHLPYAVLAAALQNLIEQNLCQKLGRVASAATGQDFGETMGYQLSEQGRARARELLERDHYVGPAPVRFAAYETSIREQALDIDVNRSRLTSALSHLVLSEDLLAELGPPIASRAPMFLYGAPGNGKTSIAEACAGLLGDHIFIPYAVDVEGQTVRIFDPLHHQAAAEDPAADQRWVPVERPFVKVGGELTPAMLGATFDPLLRFYEAPIHLKANGGIFLLDDFGRQDASPRALLNRLIVSLERRVDFLNLASAGKTVAVPFEAMVVFSTNLDPASLVDEAFLRRVRYKVFVPDPTEPEFRRIFERACIELAVPFDEKGYGDLLDRYYKKVKRPLRGCQPHDLLQALTEHALFQERPPRLEPDLIDMACDSYFVRLNS